ncbi:MAG: hypothetical protein ACYTG0_03630 [Planctomycetota bacterium]|jgi:hypothetical protein
MGKPGRSGIWDEILVDKQAPVAHIRIQVDGSSLTFETRSRRERGRDKKALDRLGGIVTHYLRKESPAWEEDEWEKMLGISEEPATWQERVLLLCRAQYEFRKNDDPDENRIIGDRGKFVMLPDDLVISVRFLKPSHSKSIIHQVPDIILLDALMKLLQEERQRAAEHRRLRQDSLWLEPPEVAKRLSEMLREWGAWLTGDISSSQVTGLQRRLQQTEHFKDVFPDRETRKERFMRSVKGGTQ